MIGSTLPCGEYLNCWWGQSPVKMMWLGHNRLKIDKKNVLEVDLKGLSFLCKMTLPCGEYWTCWWGQSPWTSLWQLSKLGCRWWACRWTCNWKKASMWKKRSNSWKTENEVKLVLICWTIYVLLEESCKVWKLVDTESGTKWFITIHVFIFWRRKNWWIQEVAPVQIELLRGRNVFSETTD